MDIKDLTIQKALEGYRINKFTAVDVVTACLENVRRYNKEYNVLLTARDEKDIIEEAKHADYSLPLGGIPIVLKDLFSTDGVRTTAGSKVLEHYTPVYDGTVVTKLKTAGAIIIGKANQDAWAHGSSGENSDFGPTTNAFSRDHVAGGSSSGSAVAVALGMCLAATGTDTGGSIRVPAVWNKLVGLKPTYGRVSRYGVVAMASSLDSIGHITKVVADSAYFLSITAGRDPYDATTTDKTFDEWQSMKTLTGVRVGIAKELPCGDEMQVFSALGAQLVPVDLPNIVSALETYYIIVPGEVSSNLARFDGVRFGNGRSAFGAEAKRRIMIGTYALSSGYYDAYYKTASKIRTLICHDFAKAFEHVDVILAPVTSSPPPKIGEKVNDPLALYRADMYTVPVNLAGLPALSLPSGIQLIGPQWSEEMLFSLGNAYEVHANHRS